MSVPATEIKDAIVLEFDVVNKCVSVLSKLGAKTSESGLQLLCKRVLCREEDVGLVSWKSGSGQYRACK